MLGLNEKHLVLCSASPTIPAVVPFVYLVTRRSVSLILLN